MTTHSLPTTTDFAGVAGLAVRLGRALERWGTRAAQPLGRADLERRRALQVEQHQARVVRDRTMYGLHRLPF
jgi:hypothetical protein